MGLKSENFNKSIIVILPRKVAAHRWESFHTINLIPPAQKNITKIIQRREDLRFTGEVVAVLFGFRKNKGMRGVVLALRLIIEKTTKKTTYRYRFPRPR